MQDTPGIVADDKEAVEDAEADRGHGQEVPWPQSLPCDSEEKRASAGLAGDLGRTAGNEKRTLLTPSYCPFTVQAPQPQPHSLFMCL
jgi:hypothetical protein